MIATEGNQGLGCFYVRNPFGETDVNLIEGHVHNLISMYTNNRGSLKKNTVVEERGQKLIFYFGFWDQVINNKNERILRNDNVNLITEFKWLKTLCKNVLEKVRGIVPYSEFNQVEIIKYDKKAKFNTHQDPLNLFEDTIVSLRLFNSRHLLFGYNGKGFQMKKQGCSWKVKQKRGQITVMSGYSATHCKHGVKAESENYSVYIVLRRVKTKGIQKKNHR